MQSAGWCHVRSKNNASFTSGKSRREEPRNIVSNFSFVIGNEKYNHKYMCFDHKNYLKKIMCRSAMMVALLESQFLANKPK